MGGKFVLFYKYMPKQANTKENVYVWRKECVLHLKRRLEEGQAANCTNGKELGSEKNGGVELTREKN